MSSAFLLILTILYLEKYLLTIIGTFACITICIGLILFIISIWKQKVLQKTGIKLIVCAVISLTIIPVSTLITHTIDQTYETSIQETIDNAVSSSKEEFIDEQTESKNVWDQIAYGFSQIVDTISSSASKAYEWAQNALNNFIEAYKQTKEQEFIVESINKDFFFEFVDCLLTELEQKDKRIQELEEKLEKANKQLDLDYVDDNYIPKQKVKDKIEK